MKVQSLGFSILTLMLYACANTPTANVPLSYAKLDTGYLNSGIYDLGWLFVWDKTQRTLTPVGPLKVPDSLKDVGPTIGQQQFSLSSDTDVEFSADLTKIAGASGNLKSQIARSTTTELDKVARETISQAEDLLNFDNEKSRNWRKRLAQDYPGDNFRFLIVDRVLRGDKVSVGFNNSVNASAGANILQFGKLNVKVTYSGKSNFVQTGNSIPLVFQAKMFRLANDSKDPQFSPVTGSEAKRFNFQQAIKQAQ
jgi:hypothetical protein